MPRKKSRKAIDKLWEKVYDSERHVLDIAENIAVLVSDGRAIHPESQIAMNLVEAQENLINAIGDACEAEENS